MLFTGALGDGSGGCFFLCWIMLTAVSSDSDDHSAG